MYVYQPKGEALGWTKGQIMLDFNTATTLTTLPRQASPNPAYEVERTLLREAAGHWAVIGRIPKTNRDYRRDTYNEAQRLRATHFPRAAGYTVRQDTRSHQYFGYVLVRYDESLVIK